MSKRVLALLFCFLFYPAIGRTVDLPAQTAPFLSLRGAVARGLQANLDLQAGAEQVPSAAAGVQAAAGRFDPQLFASASAGSERVPPAEDYVAEFERQYTAAIGLQQLFRSGFSGELTLSSEHLQDDSPINTLSPQNRVYLILDLTQPLLRDCGIEVNTTEERLSRNELAQSTERYVDRARQLGGAIEAAYLRLCLARERLILRTEARLLSADLLTGNRQKFSSGIIPVSEVQEAETALASRDEQVIAARQEQETAVNTLLDLLEIPVDDPLRSSTLTTETIPGVMETTPDRVEALRRALEQRPDLAAARLAVAARDVQLRYARNQTLPRLDLQATLGLNGLGGNSTGLSPTDDEGNMFDAAERMAQRDGYQWYTGVRFSYPLGNRTARARARQAESGKKQAIFALKRLEDTIDTEVRNALVAVSRSWERTLVAERYRSLANLTLKQEETRLKEGLSDTFHILKFQDDLIEAKLAKLNALVDYRLGLANLYQVMGTNLSRDGILLWTPGAETRVGSLTEN